MKQLSSNQKFILWFIVIMLINFVLLACAWVKINQHQNDVAINYIMVFLVVNILAKIIHFELSKIK